MDQPLVSAIVPVHNGERYLADALESIFAQTYRPYEVIVVDDGSDDDTAKIAKSFETIRYIYQVNRGAAVAYNTGIDAARGDLVAFLSHDDLWTPDKLSVQVNFLKNHPEIQYTIARVKFFLEPGFPIPLGFRKELLEGSHVGRLMDTLVARKSLFDIIGKLNPQLTTADDVDWFARTNDNAVPMAIMPNVLLHKRVHNTNISLNEQSNNQNLLKVLKQSIDRKRNHESKQKQFTDEDFNGMA